MYAFVTFGGGGGGACAGFAACGAVGAAGGVASAAGDRSAGFWRPQFTNITSAAVATVNREYFIIELRIMYHCNNFCVNALAPRWSSVIAT
jgi:hypothetical protein